MREHPEVATSPASGESDTAPDRGLPQLEIDYPLGLWVQVPPQWLDEEWAELSYWSAELADIVWTETGASADTVAAYAKILRAVAERCLDHAPEATIMLWVPRPELVVPLPVLLHVLPAWGSDTTAALRDLTLADQPDAVRKPVAEPFATTRLGTGLRVSRTIPGDEDGLFYQLRYAWRLPDHQVDLLVTVVTDDAALLLEASPDIDELVRTISIFEPAESTP